jgi:lysophospholipase L1-like esterase
MRRALLALTICAAACASSISSERPSEATDPAAAGGDTAREASRNDGTNGSPGTSASGTTKPPEYGPVEVQLIGRFERRDPAGPRCGWPGCRIVARFEGTGVTARLREIDASWMEGAPSEWDLTIDGQAKPKIALSPGQTEYVLATGLPPGPHVVELYKRSEAQNGVTQLLGLDFGSDGRLLPSPPRKARRIEIVGDSSAAGYGVEGVGLGPDCPDADWAARYQNFRLSLGERLGVAVDAEVMGSVYSGKGMAKNIWPTDPDTMPRLFLRADPLDRESTWDFAQYVPDAVVIMMGGNDFAIGVPVDQGPATLEEFTAAYTGFLELLRTNYPRARIYAVTSPSVSDAEPAGRQTRTNVLAGIAAAIARRASAGDKNVSALEPAIATKDELTGCNGHGSPAFHQRVADELAATLRRDLGW